MSNDTYRVHVKIDPKDLARLLDLKIMKFQGLDVVYKHLIFDHTGNLVNPRKIYADTVLTVYQKNELIALKEEAVKAGFSDLKIINDTCVVTDGQLEAEDNDRHRNQHHWDIEEFGDRFSNMSHAIEFFLRYVDFGEGYTVDEQLARIRIKHLLAECIEHL